MIREAQTAVQSGYRAGLVELEDTLAKTVHIGDDRCKDEEQDSAQPDQCRFSPRREVGKGHRPWVQEYDLDVEEQKNHRDFVETDVEPLAGGPDRVHSRFVRHAFDLAGA